MRLGRQIAKAKRRGMRDYNNMLEEIAEEQRKSAIGAAKGSLLGKLGSMAFTYLTPYGPLASVAMAALMEGGGQYFGGIGGAKAADVARDKMTARKGFYGKKSKQTATDIGDQTSALTSSAIQTGVAAGGRAAIASGAKEYLGSLKEGVESGELTWMDAFDPSKVAAASQQQALINASTIQGVSGPVSVNLDPLQAQIAQSQAYGGQSSALQNLQMQLKQLTGGSKRGI